MYVAEIDANGSELWHQLYGLINSSNGELYDPGHANAIAPTRDGGYIITGQSGEDLCLFKISGNGDPTTAVVHGLSGHRHFRGLFRAAGFRRRLHRHGRRRDEYGQRDGPLSVKESIRTASCSGAGISAGPAMSSAGP